MFELEFSWQHIFTEAVLGSIPVLFGLWLSHRATNKKQSESNAVMAFILKEHTPHSHIEMGDEVLTVEGIRYPKVRLNGSGSRDDA